VVVAVVVVVVLEVLPLPLLWLWRPPRLHHLLMTTTLDPSPNCDVQNHAWCS
jgi:hypothetical protein